MPTRQQTNFASSRFQVGEVEQRAIPGTGLSKRTFAVKGFLWWRVIFYEALIIGGASDDCLTIAAYTGDPLAALDAFTQDVARRKFRIVSADIVAAGNARIGCSLGITRANVTTTWIQNQELALPDMRIIGDGYVTVINQGVDFTYTEDILLIEGVRSPSYGS